jgi:hypothetical protein
MTESWNQAPEEIPPLSAQGQRRRQQILQLAHAFARKRRRRRRMAAIAPLAIVAALAASLFVARSKHPNPNPPILAKGGEPVPTVIAPPLAQPQVPQVTWIATEPGISHRLAVRDEPPMWKSISDSELVQDLAQDGKPAGLAYADGRAILIVGGRRFN